MQRLSFLPTLIDLAQTFSSVIELLFTHIFPAFAIFTISFLLQIIHFIHSLAAGPSQPRSDSSPEDRTDDGLFGPPPEDHDLPVRSVNKNPDFNGRDELSPLWSDDYCLSPVSEDDAEGSISWRGGESPGESSSLRNQLPVAELIYPFDLPASLDYVVRNPEVDSHEARHRTLPPSLSMIKKTLRENSGEDFSQNESQDTQENDPANKTVSKAPVASESKALKTQPEHFMDKFRHHFLLDP